MGERSAIAALECLEDIAKEAQKSIEKITTPESIYETLKYIVEANAEARMHSAETGMLRNHAVQEICTQLNRLQDEFVFQDNYKVEYVKKK